MKIFVKAKANSKEEKVIPPDLKLWTENERVEDYYKVYVKDPPVNGRANIAIRKILANYFNVSLSDVSLISGETSKIKIFEVSGM